MLERIKAIFAAMLAFLGISTTSYVSPSEPIYVGVPSANESISQEQLQTDTDTSQGQGDARNQSPTTAYQLEFSTPTPSVDSRTGQKTYYTDSNGYLYAIRNEDGSIQEIERGNAEQLAALGVETNAIIGSTQTAESSVGDQITSDSTTVDSSDPESANTTYTVSEDNISMVQSFGFEVTCYIPPTYSIPAK